MEHMNAFHLLIMGVVFIGYATITMVMYIKEASKCLKCKSKNTRQFSEIRGKEVCDFQECKDCGHVSFLNAAPAMAYAEKAPQK